jgi:hypothetical protein
MHIVDKILITSEYHLPIRIPVLIFPNKPWKKDRIPLKTMMYINLKSLSVV